MVESPHSEHREAREDDRVNILVVDDRPDKLLALEAILSDLKQNITTATSGREALRQLLQNDFAVILLDVNMPEMDGFETAALIRQRPRSTKTPIIFVSAINDTETHISRGYSLGAVDYILSPIVPEILRAKVAVFVDLFRKTEQVKRQAAQAAAVIRVQAARAEAEVARERLALLAEAGYKLALSLDHREIFESLARLLVPKLADFCLVDIREESELPEPFWGKPVIVYREPEREKELRSVKMACPGVHCLSKAAREAYETGRARIRNFTEGDSLQDHARSEEHLILLRQLDISSSLVVPMGANDKRVGLISLLSSRHNYGPAELSLAEAFAQRVALALENADLYKAAQEAQLEAERANFEKDRFLAMLSHELRTPLTPVLASVLTLADEPVSPDVREVLEMIRRNVELEARLIDDLLDLTRLSKGKLKLNLETVDAHALLQNVLEICNSEIEAKRLKVRLDLGAPRSYLLGDPARLQQIFWNLVKNAAKFTPAEGRISIMTRGSGNEMEIEVADTGIGIEKEMLKKIFDAFEQGTQPYRGGLGLGLAISKALVELHHGRITAESEGPNRGARFTLTFPVTSQVVMEPPPAKKAVVQEARSNLRVLLVEDHEDTNRAMTRLLQRRGYRVLSARTLNEGVQLAKAQRFDVLISDIGLPDGSGLDLLKEGFEGQQILAIALSGFGMEADTQKSQAAGFRYHLVKPVDLNKLLEIIERAS